MNSKFTFADRTPTLVNPFILFADSEVSDVSLESQRLRIIFSAAHVISKIPENSERYAEGFARNVELALTTAETDQAIDELLGRVISGRICIGNQWTERIPLPCSITLPIKLEIAFAYQSHLEVKAKGLECRFTGEPNFFESMAC